VYGFKSFNKPKKINMKTKQLFVLIIGLIFFPTILFAQTNILENECETPERDTTEFKNLPWFDNNQYLYTLLDSLGYNGSSTNYNKSIETIGVKYRIPVKFWVYRDSNGNGGPADADLQTLMDFLRCWS
jgi:hypothetical protein